VVAIATNFVTVCLLAWVAIMIGAGRGWARWLFAAIYVLGSLGIIVSIFLMPEVFSLVAQSCEGIRYVQFVLQSTALMLMFTSCITAVV